MITCLKLHFTSCFHLIDIFLFFSSFHLLFSVTSVPPSSYRLGVKASNLHELFPGHITEALQQSILAFDQEVLSHYLFDGMHFFLIIQTH